jgi:hypothetical protein
VLLRRELRELSQRLLSGGRARLIVRLRVRECEGNVERVAESTRDVLRLCVAPTSGAAGGFHVEVFVNDVEMTCIGAGLGMDVYDLLVPTNRLVAGGAPCTVPIARCACGVYGCDATDVTIVREGDRVHWDWSGHVPVTRRMTFDADAYARELDRAEHDHAWETPARTAGRLVLARVDHARLAAHGVVLSGVGYGWSDASERFRVLLRADDYQVFVTVAWGDRTPEVIADEMCALLASAPAAWNAAWHSTTGSHVAPSIAGPRWTRWSPSVTATYA